MLVGREPGRAAQQDATVRQLPTRTPDAGEAHVPVEAREVAAQRVLHNNLELRHEAVLGEPLAGGAAERRDAAPVFRPPQRLHPPPRPAQARPSFTGPTGAPAYSRVLHGYSCVAARQRQRSGHGLALGAGAP